MVKYMGNPLTIPKTYSYSKFKIESQNLDTINVLKTLENAPKLA